MYESITSAFDDNTEARMASSSPSKWVSCIMTKGNQVTLNADVHVHIFLMGLRLLGI